MHYIPMGVVFGKTYFFCSRTWSILPARSGVLYELGTLFLNAVTQPF